jgi:hypothetical protein
MLPKRYRNAAADALLLAVVLVPGTASAIIAAGWWAIPAFFAPYVFVGALFVVAWFIGPFVGGQW